MVLKLELTVLIFVRSVRSRGFELNKYVINRLLPCFFALNYVNSASWLTLHLFGMLQLPNTRPVVEHNFQMRTFGVTKSKNVFLSIGIDHAHD